jgi:hypothetical protein
MQPIATVNTARRSTTRPFGSAQGRIPRPVLLRRVGPTPPSAIVRRLRRQRATRHLARVEYASASLARLPRHLVRPTSSHSPDPPRPPSPRRLLRVNSRRSLPRARFPAFPFCAPSALSSRAPFSAPSVDSSVISFVSRLPQSSNRVWPADRRHPGHSAINCTLCPLHRDTRRKLSFR